MAKQQMVQPKAATVEIERGSGTRVTVELPVEVHQRMKLEIMRRQRQGQTANLERLAREVIIGAQEDWPRLAESE